MSVKGKKYKSTKKAVAKKKPRKSKVVKTKNNGTMSDRQFFQMLRHILRKRTVFWGPILTVRNRAKIAYKGPNKRRKFSYICENCGGEFAANEVNVHHMIPAGELNKFEDLPGFCKRLFCEKEDLKLLCTKCHDKEHE